MAQWLFTEAADFETKFGAFLSAKRERGEEVDAAVATIIAKLRRAGNNALSAYTEAFDGHRLEADHVLPTDRSARFSSGLGVLDFIKRTSILKTRSEALPVPGCHAIRVARAEGLEAHARSIAIRLNEP
jgi:histidinol dehydrogenase